MLRRATISLYIVSLMLLGCNHVASPGGGGGYYSEEHGFVHRYQSSPQSDGTYYENVPFVHAWRREANELYGFVLPFPDSVIQFVEIAQGNDASTEVLYEQTIATGHGYRSDSATFEIEIERSDLEKFIDVFLAELESHHIPATDPVRDNWEEDGIVYFHAEFDEFSIQVEYKKVDAKRFSVVVDCLTSF